MRSCSLIAWMVPTLIRQRLGSFEIDDLEPLTTGQWLSLMRESTPAHRMPETMAVVLQRATRRVVTKYAGNASKIWAHEPSSGTVVRRFLESHGGGPKIATMAANILVRDFHIQLSDYRYIDISADVQVNRIMTRLGFVEELGSRCCYLRSARNES